MPSCFQPGHVRVAQPGAVAVRVRFDVQFLDVAAVGVDLEVGQHPPAFVVVAVGELVAGGDGLHADLPEELLVMVGPGAADEEHGRFALAAGLDFLPHPSPLRASPGR